MEFMPLPIKIIEKSRVPDNKPLLLLLFISRKISCKKTDDSFGNNDSSKFKKSMSKFSMGKNGIRFKTNSKNGKKAIKKLKEILPALVEIAPFKIPVTYNLSKSYNENPYKNSNFIFCKKFKIFLVK